MLLSVEPIALGLSGDTYPGSNPPADSNDLVVCAKRLQEAYDAVVATYGASVSSFCRALVVRTNYATSPHDYTGSNPPYITKEAIAWICDKNVEHILIDLPLSIEKSAARAFSYIAHFRTAAFWGLRAKDGEFLCKSTITELCSVPPAATDGLYMLSLQIAPFDMDAAPSRPILYPVKK